MPIQPNTAAPLMKVGGAYATKRARTYLWAAIFLLQEISVPNIGTADNSIRTQAPFAIFANPGKVLLSALIAIIAIGSHNFSPTANLFISLIVLCMPVILLSIERTDIDPQEFSSTVIMLIFVACLVQSLLPGIANSLFSPFLDGYMSFDGYFSRATAFSMEPSFAAETLFAIAMVYFFFSRSLCTWTVAFIVGALLLIRAGTTLQQAFIFASVFVCLKLVNLATRAPVNGNRVSFFTFSLSSLFALASLFFGYSLLFYGEFNLSFITDSLEKYGSWRTLSNYAALLNADPISFFPYHTATGWREAITYGLYANGLEGDGWIVQPFSAIGVAFLDLGLIGTAIWIFIVFKVAQSRYRRYALSTYRLAIIYTLLINTIVFAPKWQLSGFLAIGLIASELETRLRNAGIRK